MHEHESPVRSFAKSITWRILASITTFVLVYIFTGEITLALGVGLTEVVLKFILFFTHERVWDRVTWGKVMTKTEGE